MSGLDSNTKLLLHLNETPYIDQIGHTVGSTSSPPRISGGVFGDCADFNAGSTSADYIGINKSSDLQPGSSAWTFDFWIKRPSSPDNSNRKILSFCPDNGSLGYSGVLLQYNGSGNIVFYFSSNLSGWNITSQVVFNFDADVWTHAAIQRDSSGNYSFYKNGILQNTAFSSLALPTPTHPTYGVIIYNRSSLNNGFVGQLDELRYSTVARYSSNFTPPTSPYSEGVNYDSISNISISTNQIPLGYPKEFDSQIDILSLTNNVQSNKEIYLNTLVEKVFNGIGNLNSIRNFNSLSDLNTNTSFVKLLGLSSIVALNTYLESYLNVIRGFNSSIDISYNTSSYLLRKFHKIYSSVQIEASTLSELQKQGFLSHPTIKINSNGSMNVSRILNTNTLLNSDAETKVQRLLRYYSTSELQTIINDIEAFQQRRFNTGISFSTDGIMHTAILVIRQLGGNFDSQPHIKVKTNKIPMHKFILLVNKVNINIRTSQYSLNNLTIEELLGSVFEKYDDILDFEIFNS